MINWKTLLIAYLEGFACAVLSLLIVAAGIAARRAGW
jgi:hypothetical protein